VGKAGAHLLTLGAELRRESLRNAGLAGGKDDASHQALFAQDEVGLAQDWVLTAGLRADHHEYFGTEASPRAYLVWEAAPGLVVKGGYGHAFKAPTLKQISPSYVGAEGPHTFLGNANVKPESSDSLELGADWQLGDVKLRGVVYHTRVNDLITTRQVARVGTRITYQYDNVNRAEVSGAELGLTWRVSPQLTWSADLTRLHTRDKDTGLQLMGRPRWTLNAKADLTLDDGWSARVGGEYTGQQLTALTATTTTTLPGYSLFNASVARQVGKHVTLRAGVNNLGNVRLAQKSPNFAYAERARTVFVNLRADF
jgi:outer membrane receptor for ferrienterochelin and colicins